MLRWRGVPLGRTATIKPQAGGANASGTEPRFVNERFVVRVPEDKAIAAAAADRLLSETSRRTTSGGPAAFVGAPLELDIELWDEDLLSSRFLGEWRARFCLLARLLADAVDTTGGR